MTATGWTGEGRETEGPATPAASLLLSARAERGPVDPLERARQAVDDLGDDDPFGADERAANLLARGYAPGQVSDLAQRYAETMAELETERAKISRAELRQERVARDHAAGRITAFDIAAMGDLDEGDAHRAEQLERRADTLRRQLGEAQERVVTPWQELAADGVEAASRTAHDVFTEVTRVKMAAAQTGRPVVRPFGSVSRGALAVRSEQCVHCADQGVDPETSFLLHSDPERNVPVTTAAQAAAPQVQRAQAYGAEGYYDASEIVRGVESAITGVR